MAPAILASGLLLGWLVAHWFERRHDRAPGGGSDSLLDELEMAWTPRRSHEIRCRAERLGHTLEILAGEVDRGFSRRQARQLHARIIAHRSRIPRHDFYHVKVAGQKTTLDFQWSRDPDDRVRLLVLAVPKIIRALKRHHRPASPLPAPAHDWPHSVELSSSEITSPLP
jgi:hypothetical protein